MASTRRHSQTERFEMKYLLMPITFPLWILCKLVNSKMTDTYFLDHQDLELVKAQLEIALTALWKLREHSLGTTSDVIDEAFVNIAKLKEKK